MLQLRNSYSRDLEVCKHKGDFGLAIWLDQHAPCLPDGVLLPLP